MLRRGSWLRFVRGLFQVHPAKDGDVQPRLRTLVWKEMPPCVRRFAIGWSRQFLYAELFLGRMYLSWTKSPTWNFVAIAGTLGIMLTILLFLAPWDAEADAVARSTRKGVRTARPNWEIDSRLVAIQTKQDPPYPVEFLFARDSRSVGHRSTVKTEGRSRRRIRDAAEDQPLLPLIAPEPAEPEIAVRLQPRVEREPDRDFDWTISAAPESPLLSFDSEFVPPTRRRRRDPVEADVTWTGRTTSPELGFSPRRSRFDLDDLWQPFDVTRVVHAETLGSDTFGDRQTVPASHADRPLGRPWEPLAAPAAAPNKADVQLELSWNRTSSRRRRDPQLQVRNVGSEPIERVDVLSGPLPRTDLSSPATFLTQAIAELLPGNDESVSLPFPASRRRTAANVVSVLVTAFVGNTTRVEPVVAARRRDDVEEVAPRVKVREPSKRSVTQRPHLSMTTGRPGRLDGHKMITVPIVVTNDGNVSLSEIVILAEIPATLEHEHGRTVHYRVGRLQPGEQRSATLLLTPLEAGSTTVPLEATDGKRLALAKSEAGIRVADDELADRPDARVSSRRHAERSSRRK